MEVSKVNVEKNTQQSENFSNTTTQVPKLVIEWKKRLNEEFEKAHSLANNFYSQQVIELNDIIFFYLHKPCKLNLALRLNEYQLDLFKIIPANNEKKCTPIRLWSCNHPIRELDTLSPTARKEYYRACLSLLQSEYGCIQWEKFFIINSDEYDEKEEQPAKTATAKSTKTAEPAKIGVVVDDIEQLFSQRGMHK